MERAADIYTALLDPRPRPSNMSRNDRTRDGQITRGGPPAAPDAARYRVCRAASIAPGTSRKFLLPVRGVDEECFVVNFQGQYYAYVNRCRHVPMAMDWIDNQFFAEQGRYLMCQTHCAYYEPSTGECINGPPSACGKSLYRVPLEIRRGIIYARPPEQEFDD
jgi:nitrite reductase/ring-hydroxylating ferredoxin subunit